LLVSQNPDELRATGGYIGSAGVVSLRDGAVGLVEYGSSRRYDTPADRRAIPPGPFQPYLGAGYWNLAAANWWPSFPDAAHQMAYFYGLSHPQPPVDGVIALDQVGFRHLLEVVGPVAIPEYGERVAADTLQGQIDRYVHAGDPDDELGRKHYMAALSTALLQRLLVAPRDELPRLVRAVRQSLDEQHLLVWMRDPSTAEMFARRHWDGDLLATDRDTLMLVDTEVSGSKQSQHVSRDAEYRVDLSEPGAPAAALTVTYTNASNREQQPDLPYFVVDYRTFLRVYAPPGAELTRAEGFRRLADSAEECGRTVFSGEVLIPQDSRVQVVLEYRLPQSVLAEGEYDVLVQQQPGVPPGHVLVSAMTPTGPVSPVELTSTPGQHAHWALRPLGEAAHFEDRPLPAGHAGGCSLPVVEARPIAPPVWLEIPAAHISAPIVDLGVADDGQMESPATPDVVGWYRMSARAGQPGNSVMSGHVDWGRNTAVFWGLRALRPGDRIEVRGADGLTHDYAVEWNTTLDARTAPAERLVGRSYDSLLTLITCDGVYDRARGGYSERRIVRARLVT
jgi:hypothetical protein